MDFKGQSMGRGGNKSVILSYETGKMNSYVRFGRSFWINSRCAKLMSKMILLWKIIDTLRQKLSQFVSNLPHKSHCVIYKM